MDLTDTITDNSENGAIGDVPMLPTLPPAPVLPAASNTETPPEPMMSLPPLRPNPAANAAYGVMPAKPRAGEPSPATLRAAEIRRQAKKRRRIKRIAMLVAAIVIGALAGPPTARWVSDNLDKAGSTETESPPPADD